MEIVDNTNQVFTLQSIKSRIETILSWPEYHSYSVFLLYSPLNQGLKHNVSEDYKYELTIVFTLQSIKSRIETNLQQKFLQKVSVFLLYSPLNQGLKLWIDGYFRWERLVFTLQSIKSRIETCLLLKKSLSCLLFLLYSPLNQGLKQEWTFQNSLAILCFYSTVH